MSAPKPKQKLPLVAIVAGLVLLVVLVAAGLFWLWHQRATCGMRIGSACFGLERADTPDARTQGLSGRSELLANQAMLFVYDKPRRECLWMKDMNFALDMVWLNADKRIVTIKQNVSPNTYPEVFCPTQAAQYILEMPASTVQHNGLTAGQQLDF